MGEYEKTIMALNALANADEGDRITNSDLAECSTAVAIIEDLVKDNEFLRHDRVAIESKLKLAQKSIDGQRYTLKELRERRTELEKHIRELQVAFDRLFVFGKDNVFATPDNYDTFVELLYSVMGEW